MITRKDKIPTKGDTLEKVLVNKARTICQLVFSSGKTIQTEIDPTEFGMKSEVKNNPVKNENVKKSKVDSMTRNSPEDQEYKNKVLETLGRMSGMTKEEIAEQISSNAPASVQMQQLNETHNAPAMDEDFERKKDAAIRRSEERSARLAKEIAMKSGAKLEGSFTAGQGISIG